jgi:hypothetical protein
MRTIILTALILVAHVCVAQQLDFLTEIKNSPEITKALGIEKLNNDELASLNKLLNTIYQLGAEHQAQGKYKMQTKPVQSGATQTPSTPLYITKIDDDNDDVLKLDNGAIVEITLGYLGYVGYRKDAVLYKDGEGWKIWIEGKKAFRCEILKAPDYLRSMSGKLVTISDVKGDGNILIALGGSMYEVDDLYTIDTSLWLAPFEALIIDDTRLLNLEEGGEIIDITKLR